MKLGFFPFYMLFYVQKQNVAWTESNTPLAVVAPLSAWPQHSAVETAGCRGCCVLDGRPVWGQAGKAPLFWDTPAGRQLHACINRKQKVPSEEAGESLAKRV